MTNDITLDDAKLAEIEAAALYRIKIDEAFPSDPWDTQDTQPRVALALVAEIRRLRAEVEAARPMLDLARSVVHARELGDTSAEWLNVLALRNALRGEGAK